MSHTTHFDDCGCLTANYERRLDAQKEAVASLEAKVATLEADRVELMAQVWPLKENNNALRDALVKCAPGGVEREDECRAMKRWRNWWRDHACPALAQTPAASLAALKAEVLERAAAVADDYDGDGVSKSGQYTQLGDGALTRSDIAKAIRALAAQAATHSEQEVKP